MFFILNKKSKHNLGSKHRCTNCKKETSLYYNPMPEWSIDGELCGDCYSKKLAEFYPGEHVRVNKE